MSLTWYLPILLVLLSAVGAESVVCTERPDGSALCVLVGDRDSDGLVACGRGAVTGPNALRNSWVFEPSRPLAMVRFDAVTSQADVIRIEVSARGQREPKTIHEQHGGRISVSPDLSGDGVIFTGGEFGDLEVIVACRRGETAGNTIGPVVIAHFVPVPSVPELPRSARSGPLLVLKESPK